MEGLTPGPSSFTVTISAKPPLAAIGIRVAAVVFVVNLSSFLVPPLRRVGLLLIFSVMRRPANNASYYKSGVELSTNHQKGCVAENLVKEDELSLEVWNMPRCHTGLGIPLARKINCESEKVVSPFSFRVIDQIMGSFPHSLIFRIPPSLYSPATNMASMMD